MSRLKTVIGYASAAGLFCLQSASGFDANLDLPSTQPNRTVTGPVETTEEVFHAVSNRSPSVITSPPATNSSAQIVAEIQQVSAEDTASNAAVVNSAVFASHPIHRVKYSEREAAFTALTVNRNYANLSPSPCEKLTQATPLEINTTVSDPAPVEVVDQVESPTYIEELKHLAPDLVEVESSTAADSYVAELNSLLHGPSPWILARGGMLDLRPEEPEPVGTSDTYMNELQSLVTRTKTASLAPTQHDARTLTRFTAMQSQQQRPIAEPKTTYVIPQQGFCETRGSKTVDGLFAPLSIVDVSGTSTAPPEVPPEAKQMELDLPENFACSYMQSGIPTYYMTRGYGTRRAPRNTHKFYNNPLYFEDPNLERCGQSNGCLSTFTSAIQFATMAALLPYQTAADHPRDCVAALPDCPTCQSFGPDAYFPEWSWKAAAVQGAAVTGLIFIIP